MAWDWDINPDAARVVSVVKEATAAGVPTHVHLIVEFTKDSVLLGTRRVPVTADYLASFGVEDAQEKFDQLYNLVPDVPQSVKDQIYARMTKAMLKSAWRGRRVE